MASSSNQGASSTSSACIPYSWTYDVFLSFRGEDTRYGFTSHLHRALINRGINAFIDDELTRGEDISRQLLKVIEESRSSLIVFSQNYASSKWCLDELVQILTTQQIVHPIFYKVDPSDVRNQRKSFGEALCKHDKTFADNLEKVNKWRAALTKAATLSGWHYDDSESESKFIDRIAEDISGKLLYRTYLPVADYPVGIESRVHDVEKLLDVGENDRRVIGIWGPSGIGKTTIAKAVYNSIAHRFEGRCFLKNVGEKSGSAEGQVQLQESLLSEILRGTKWNLSSPEQGINVIKQRLSNVKVLLVLDDVNKMEWLSKLEGLFAEGSRTIVTTKYKRFLSGWATKSVYEVKKLDEKQSLELFNRHAFKIKSNEAPNEEQKQKIDQFAVLATRATGYVQGLPLALEVFGSHLGTLTTVDSWMASLNAYNCEPAYTDRIQTPFRICYKALHNEVKQVFLDIACFFNGKEKDFVIDMLREDDDGRPDVCIDVLVQNALVSIEYNRILMHNLLEQMGKDIVQEESPTDPGKCSRLWSRKDVVRVLTHNTGTSNIKGIIMKFPVPVEIQLTGESFSGMKNLQYIININARLSGHVNNLPNSLKLIDWGRCELKSFPSDFHPKELVMLNMPHSRIRKLGEGFKSLTKLTHLNFQDCKFLKQLPDLSGSSNIKSLVVSGCKRLKKVHDSIGFLEKLVTLDFTGCSNLESFPPKVNWKSLKDLILVDCKRLENFPEIEEKMQPLQSIKLDGSGIKELPTSIRYLTELISLSVDRCKSLATLPSSIYELQNLVYLGLNYCPKLAALPIKGNSEVGTESPPLVLRTENCASPRLPAYIPLRLNFEGCQLEDLDMLENVDCLFNLVILYLSGSSFDRLPVCLGKFVNLTLLYLCQCKELREILVLPPLLRYIYLVDCTSLVTFSALSRILKQGDTHFFYKMDLSNCSVLNVEKMADALLKIKVDNSFFEVVFKGDEIPEYFDCRKDVSVLVDNSSGDRICELVVEIPHNFIWEDTGLAFCVVFEITEEYYGYCGFEVQITINEHSVPSNGSDCFFESKETCCRPHVWLQYIPLPVDIKRQLDSENSSVTYMCRIIFSGEGHGLLLRSCGVKLACFPRGDYGDDKENDDDTEEDVEEYDDDAEEEEEEGDQDDDEDHQEQSRCLSFDATESTRSQPQSFDALNPPDDVFSGEGHGLLLRSCGVKLACFPRGDYGDDKENDDDTEEDVEEYDDDAEEEEEEGDQDDDEDHQEQSRCLSFDATESTRSQPQSFDALNPPDDVFSGEGHGLLLRSCGVKLACFPRGDYGDDKENDDDTEEDVEEYDDDAEEEEEEGDQDDDEDHQEQSRCLSFDALNPPDPNHSRERESDAAVYQPFLNRPGSAMENKDDGLLDSWIDDLSPDVDEGHDSGENGSRLVEEAVLVSTAVPSFSRPSEEQPFEVSDGGGDGGTFNVTQKSKTAPTSIDADPNAVTFWGQHTNGGGSSTSSSKKQKIQGVNRSSAKVAQAGTPAGGSKVTDRGKPPQNILARNIPDFSALMPREVIPLPPLWDKLVGVVAKAAVGDEDFVRMIIRSLFNADNDRLSHNQHSAQENRDRVDVSQLIQTAHNLSLVNVDQKDQKVAVEALLKEEKKKNELTARQLLDLQVELNDAKKLMSERESLARDLFFANKALKMEEGDLRRRLVEEENRRASLEAQVAEFPSKLSAAGELSLNRFKATELKGLLDVSYKEGWDNHMKKTIAYLLEKKRQIARAVEVGGQAPTDPQLVRCSDTQASGGSG